MSYINALHGSHENAVREMDSLTHRKDVKHSPPTLFTISNSVNLRRQANFDVQAPNVFSNDFTKSTRNYDFETTTDFARAGSQHAFNYGYLSSASMSFNFYNIRSGSHQFSFFAEHGGGTALESVVISITPGFYNSIDKVIDALNQSFTNAFAASTDYATDYVMTVTRSSQTLNGTAYIGNTLQLKLTYSGGLSNVVWKLSDAPSNLQPSYEPITQKTRHRLVDIGKVTGLNWHELNSVIHVSGSGVPAGAIYVSNGEINLFHIRNVKIMANLVTNQYGGALCVLHHNNIGQGHLLSKSFNEMEQHAFKLRNPEILKNVHIRCVDEEDIPLQGHGSVQLTFGIYQSKASTTYGKRVRLR